jgi:hypothetical protein
MNADDQMHRIRQAAEVDILRYVLAIKTASMSSSSLKMSSEIGQALKAALEGARKVGRSEVTSGALPDDPPIWGYVAVSLQSAAETDTHVVNRVYATAADAADAASCHLGWPWVVSPVYPMQVDGYAYPTVLPAAIVPPK